MRRGDPEATAGLAPVSGGGGKDVDAGMEPEGIAAGETLEPLRAEDIAADGGKERGRGVERGARGIPLEEDELDVVEGSPLAGPEGAGELVDRPRSLRQKTLHEGLRAGLQPLDRGLPAVDRDGNRIDVRLGEHLEGEDRRVDLDEARAVEAPAERGANAGAVGEALTERRDADRWRGQFGGTVGHARPAAVGGK